MGEMVAADVGVDHACMLSKLKGNNTILFPKEGNLACWAESIETAVSAEEAYLEKRFERNALSLVMIFH